MAGRAEEDEVAAERRGFLAVWEFGATANGQDELGWGRGSQTDVYLAGEARSDWMTCGDTTVERGALQMGPTSGRYVGLNGLTRTPHRTCCPCTVLVQNG